MLEKFYCVSGVKKQKKWPTCKGFFVAFITNFDKPNIFICDLISGHSTTDTGIPSTCRTTA